VARRRKTADAASRSDGAAWEKLTWDDLDDWTGSRTVSRGKSYQRQGRVNQLAISDAGVLLAWVDGSHAYATRVEFTTSSRKRSDRIVSQCSCPVRHACKHAVAVILEYLKAIEDSADVPAVTDADPRWEVSMEGGFESGHIDDDDDSLNDGRDDSPGAQDARPAKDPSARTDGRSQNMLREARTEMRSLTAQDAWWDSWKRKGHIPDYSRLEQRLRTLLDRGFGNEVVELGKELLQRGIAQIERSDDEGMTSDEIGRCMQVVRKALLKSDLSDEEKLIYAIDVLLADDYGICDDFHSVLQRRWKEATWSAVADRLGKRLDKLPKVSKSDDEWPRTYKRDLLSGRVIDALDHAGRSDEATRLCTDEARAAGSYTRAVRRLLEDKQLELAEELAQEGLRATSPMLAGVIHDLQDLLSAIAVEHRDWKLTASVAADRFFEGPSVDGYRRLLKAAEKARCKQSVRKGAQAFLETGLRPDRGESKTTSPWPLPPAPQGPEDPRRFHRANRRVGPHFDVLIDLAIDDDRPRNALKWFNRQQTAREPSSGRWLADRARRDARVAEAVESSHPRRAVVIYEQVADAIASEANTKTYREAGHYLTKIKQLLQQAGRQREWPAILGKFREKHGRKRRFMEELDVIEGLAIPKVARRLLLRK